MILNDERIKSYIKDSKFEGCKSSRGGAIFFQAHEISLEIIGDTTFTDNMVVKKQMIIISRARRQEIFQNVDQNQNYIAGMQLFDQELGRQLEISNAKSSGNLYQN